MIITFFPHPRKVVRGGSHDVRLINTLQEKIDLLSWQKIDHLVIVPFTEAFSQMTAQEYIEAFLLAKFSPHTVIIGYDHRFGKGRQGDYHLLEQFSSSAGFELQEIPVQLLDEVSVSSTRIREAILRADIATASQLLGYPFFFCGKVIKGNQLGRTLGYPTANLELANQEKLTPADGVYAVEAQLLPAEPNNGSNLSQASAAASGASAEPAKGHASPGIFEGPRLQGMMGIGIRPTINGTHRTIEVNLFDFDEDIYGRELRVFVIKYLRPELKFNSLDELKDALAQDKLDSLAALRPAK